MGCKDEEERDRHRERKSATLKWAKLNVLQSTSVRTQLYVSLPRRNGWVAKEAQTQKAESNNE